MPLDPNIILQGRVPTIDSPMEMYGKTLQLKHLMRAGQLQDIAIQEHKRDMADEQRFREILAEHGGNLDAALPAAAGQVGTKVWLNYQNAAIKQAQERAATAKTKGETQKIEREFFGNLALGVKGRGYDPTAFAASLDTARKLNPDYADHINQIQQAVTANPALAQQFVDGLIDQSGVGLEDRKVKAAETTAQARKMNALTEQRRADAYIAHQNAQLPGILADAQGKRILAGQLSDLGMSQKDRETLDEAAKRDAAIERYRTGELRLGQQRNAISRDRLTWDMTDDGTDGNGKPMTGGQRATDRRVNAKRDDSLGTEEYALHQQRRAIGAALSVADGSEFTDPKTRKTLTMDAQQRAQLTGQLADATNRVNDIRKKRGLQPVASSGGGYVRTATGKNGQKIGQKADGVWYDVKTGKSLQ